ncbi:MAG: GNAT family N-acetyltransferase [Mangrovicoccus sp.]
MIIRKMTRQDIPGLLHLAQQLARHVQDPDPRLDPKTLAELAFTDPPWVEALVAESDGQLLGLAAFSQSFELHTNCRMLRLSDLVISDHARGMGLGTALLHALRDLARNRGCHEIRLELWLGNDQARKFYGKQTAEQLPEIELWRLPL